MRYACASLVSLQSEWYRKKGRKEEMKERGRASFRTVDKNLDQTSTYR